MSKSPAGYTHGSIGGTMLKTAFSMIPATLAISGYNIADTYFVSRLGTMPLAAMGFTFPVIMLIGCVYRGISIGAMTPLAHSLGGGKTAKAAKVASSGLLLIAICSLIAGVAGYAAMNWTFRSFGAGPEVMPMIEQYMSVWFAGNLTVALAMTGNDFMIAVGAPRTAGILMMSGMLLNVVLDPIFIFGFGPVPAMGIRGAAIATVLSQFAAAAALLLLFYYRYHLLTRRIFEMRLLRSSWNVIIRIAIPSIIGTLMMPIGNAVITRIVAEFGDDVVAACAASGRLEMAAFIVPMSLGMALTPMVAQNFGARAYERINQCRRFAMRFAGWFELFMAAVYFVAAPWLARLFSDDPRVIAVMTAYLRIIPLGFGMMEIHRYCGFLFTGCNRPAMAAWLNALRLLGLLVPLSLGALWLHSLHALFAARLISDLLSGTIGLCLVRNMTRRLLTSRPGNPAAPADNAEPACE